ncbi:MAG: PAS domain S-box protein [Verrucomicrobia bacterium]|nr:PAS domain S-box protein [Verrucomicrobiota bacterium]
MSEFLQRVTSRPPAVRQVWMLAFLAVGATGLVLLLMTLAGNRVRRTSEELAVKQDTMHKLAVSLELHLSQVQYQQLEWLAGRTPARNDSMAESGESLIQRLQIAQKTPEFSAISNNIASLEASLLSLTSFTEECRTWNESYAQTVAALAGVKTQSDTLIRGAGAVVTSSEGRMRLPKARRLRELRTITTGAETTRLAREIAADQAFREVIDEVQHELATLELLTERLLGTQQSDQLPTFRDDLLPGSLHRLTRGINWLATQDAILATNIGDLQRSLEKRIMGSSPSMDSRVTANNGDEGSLYALCWARVELEKQRGLLRESSTRRIDEIRGIATESQITFSHYQHSISEQASTTMKETSRRLLLAGVVCGSLLLLLARGIATTLKRQIVTIEHNSAALDLAARQAQAAADAVRKSEERTRLIVDTALDAVIAMDDHGYITGWNRQAEATFGWNLEEVRGRKLGEVIVPERLRESHEKGLSRFLTTRSSTMLNRRIEVPALRKDGQEISIELSVTPIDCGGSLTFSAFLRDISARKQTEADLVKAKDQAEEASRAKSDFLATMSHEIRTPMNGILGFSSLLLDSGLTEEQRDYANTIKGSTDALLAIINDILDFSKVEAGRLELENSWFDLADVTREVSRLLSAQARAKNLQLKLQLPLQPLPFVFGDPARVRQILINLAGNSLKFTQAGGIWIGIEYEPVPASANPPAPANQRSIAGRLRVTLTDTGIGIPRNKHDQLFQKFVQADSSHSRRFGGTGLGLAISKRLVELMGGEIGFESEEGKGSKFWFTLTCEEVNSHPSRSHGAPVELHPAEQGDSPADSLRGLRVLVAEDNRTNQVLVTKLLNKAGCVVDLARDGREAVTLACERDYAVVLMDCQMPELDGHEATVEIRGWEAALRGVKPDAAPARLPIIALTASMLEEDRRHCLANGMDDLISKPVTPAELYDTLRKWTSRRPQAVKAP